ncbi:MAG TPA: SET domain-containing protein, partial [Polyangiaceae bacterium]
MVKRRPLKPMFSLSPVLFRDSPIEGRGVFAKRRFAPGDVILAYAPKQRRIEARDPEAVAAAASKLTLLSETWWVIIPDTSVPGGWLCNHSCDPNAAIYSDGEGRIQCVRSIVPGEEVTIFYGWVTQNQPGRDPC